MALAVQGGTPLKPLDTIAVFLEQYKDELPQLGRVVTITSDGVELEWLIQASIKMHGVCQQSVLLHL